jgi:hypothetical protein
MNMKTINIIFLLLSSIFSFAQNSIGIGTSTPNPQAILEINSNSKGVLISRLTTIAKNALGGALTASEDGMLIYDKDLSSFFYWDGPSLQWAEIGSSNHDSWGTQVVQTSGSNISGDGTTANPLIVSEVDGDTLNEIQTISLSNDTISLSNDTSSVVLSDYLDNTDNQTISLSNDTLSIENGNSIVIPLNTPAGAVMAFNLATCPTNWAAADGTNSTPDLRGEFVRGLDNGRGADPGRVLASSQNDEIKTHTHSTVQMIGNNNIDGVDSVTTHSGEHHNEARQTGASGGNETRPRNVALLYCIKQ